MLENGNLEPRKIFIKRRRRRAKEYGSKHLNCARAEIFYLPHDQRFPPASYQAELSHEYQIPGA